MTRCRALIGPHLQLGAALAQQVAVVFLGDADGGRALLLEPGEDLPLGPDHRHYYFSCEKIFGFGLTRRKEAPSSNRYYFVNHDHKVLKS